MEPAALMPYWSWSCWAALLAATFLLSMLLSAGKDGTFWTPGSCLRLSCLMTGSCLVPFCAKPSPAAAFGSDNCGEN